MHLRKIKCLSAHTDRKIMIRTYQLCFEKQIKSEKSIQLKNNDT